MNGIEAKFLISSTQFLVPPDIRCIYVGFRSQSHLTEPDRTNNYQSKPKSKMHNHFLDAYLSKIFKEPLTTSNLPFTCSALFISRNANVTLMVLRDSESSTGGYLPNFGCQLKFNWMKLKSLIRTDGRVAGCLLLSSQSHSLSLSLSLFLTFCYLCFLSLFLSLSLSLSLSRSLFRLSYISLSLINCLFPTFSLTLSFALIFTKFIIF